MPTLHALLVAINEYPNPRHALNGCVNDLKAMQQYLETHCERSSTELNCLMLTDDAATRQAVIEGFDLFQQAQPGETCLFFYAGHGAQWASPEAFWWTEPDRYNESLVLYDSREAGGRDLMDKELSYLLWKATHERNLHFVAITDCCHSGTITRLMDEEVVPLKERRIEKVDTAVPIEDYLGIEHYNGYEKYVREGTGEVAPPRGDYIHLSASRANQTAKEVKAKGEPRGAFSYFLGATLRITAGQISYAELLQRISIYLQQHVREQNPQLEALKSEYKDFAFLSGEARLAPGELLLSHNRTLQWHVNAGALRQVRATGEEPTQFELINEQHTVTATDVQLNTCQIDGMEGYDKRKVYPVRMLPAPPEGVDIAFAPGNERPGQQVLEELLERQAPKLYRLQADPEGAQYLIHCKEGYYYLTAPYDDRPLFKRRPGYEADSATAFLNQLETISHWRQLLGLHNPGTRIKAEEIRIELFRGTEAGNDSNEASMEPLDWRETALFPYQHDGQQWQRPAFQLKLTNTSNRTLWCSLVFLGDNFSVSDQLMYAQELKPGEFAWALEDYDGETYRTHCLEMHDIYQQWGITNITDYFKVIISTQAFDTHPLNQKGLALEGRDSSTRSFRRRSSVPRFDWATKDIKLQIHRPLPALQLQPQQTAEQFEVQLAPVGEWQANARWTTLAAATADEEGGFNGYLPDGSYFSPAEMGPEASRPGLCGLELWGIKATASDAPTALHLTFEDPERKEGLQVYCWNSNEGKLVDTAALPGGANALKIAMDSAWRDGEIKVQLFFHNSGLGGRVTFTTI